MCLVAKYDKLVKHLEECEYHGDTELQMLVDKLGLEVDEAEDYRNSSEDRMNEIINFRKYGREY